MSRQKISRALKRAICIEYMQSGKKGVKGVSVKGVKRISALGGVRVILEVIFIYNILYININIYNNII